jgi:anti-repressor protein
MNGLIKITENEKGEQLVSARDLHKFLEAGSDVGTWFKNQAIKAMLEENEDFTQIVGESTGGRPSIDYALNISSAKEISMLNGGEKGKQARKYFIECEKIAKDMLEINPRIPKTYLESILELGEALKEKERLQLSNNVLEVKLDVLLDWVSILKIAKHNEVSEKEFSWRKLKKASKALGYEIKRAESPRFGYQNLYHVNCFKQCFPKFNYDIK